MRICIFGCGRMGARTANMMCEAGHEVTVIDKEMDSLSATFDEAGIRE